MTTLAQSLWALAAKLEDVPSLDDARAEPSVPLNLLCGVQTLEDVRRLSREFGQSTRSHVTRDGQKHLSFDVVVGTACLHVYAFGDPE